MQSEEREEPIRPAPLSSETATIGVFCAFPCLTIESVRRQPSRTAIFQKQRARPSGVRLGSLLAPLLRSGSRLIANSATAIFPAPSGHPNPLAFNKARRLIDVLDIDGWRAIDGPSQGAPESKATHGPDRCCHAGRKAVPSRNRGNRAAHDGGCQNATHKPFHGSTRVRRNQGWRRTLKIILTGSPSVHV